MYKLVILNENFITKLSSITCTLSKTQKFQFKTINIPVNNLNLRENSGFHEGQRKKERVATIHSQKSVALYFQIKLSR